MDTIKEYVETISNEAQRARMEELFQWMEKTFPELSTRIGWNQPMYTHHGTFIIGFSISKKHMAAAPEQVAVDRFSEAVKQAGYDHTKELIRFPWNKPLDYGLLEEIIRFNIADKAETKSFWRKA